MTQPGYSLLADSRCAQETLWTIGAALPEFLDKCDPLLHRYLQPRLAEYRMHRAKRRIASSQNIFEHLDGHSLISFAEKVTPI